LHTKQQVSDGLQINVITILFYCNFHVLSVLLMTSHFHIMALWQVICIP